MLLSSHAYRTSRLSSGLTSRLSSCHSIMKTSNHRTVSGLRMVDKVAITVKHFFLVYRREYSLYASFSFCEWNDTTVIHHVHTSFQTNKRTDKTELEYDVILHDNPTPIGHLLWWTTQTFISNTDSTALTDVAILQSLRRVFKNSTDVRGSDFGKEKKRIDIYSMMRGGWSDWSKWCESTRVKEAVNFDYCI